MRSGRISASDLNGTRIRDFRERSPFSLFGSNREIDRPDDLRIADDFDGSDLTVGERKPEDAEEAASGGDDYAHISIHQNRTGEFCAAGGFDSFFGPRCGTTAFSRNARSCGRVVNANDDVRIKNRNECVEVCGAKSCNKFVDNFALLHEFRAGRWRRALNPTASAACELTRSFESATDDLSDFVERRAEQIVKHKCEPLGRIETVENDEQRESDGVRQDCFLLWVDLCRNNGWWRQIWRVRGERFFAA